MSLSASTSLMITSAGLHFHLHSLRPLLTPHETNKKMKRKRKNERKQTTTLNRFECRMREWKKNGIQTEYHQLVSKNHQAREFRCTFLNKRLSKQFVKDHQFSTQIPKQTKRPNVKKNKQTKKSNEKNGKSGEVKEIQIKQENMETFQSNADQAHYCGIRTVKKWNLLNILSEISQSCAHKIALNFDGNIELSRCDSDLDACFKLTSMNTDFNLLPQWNSHKTCLLLINSDWG